MRILAIHPSNDWYGSDRMFLRTMKSMKTGGHDPIAVLPEVGDLTRAMEAMRIPVRIEKTLVLRKNLSRLREGLPELLRSPMALVRHLRTIKSERIDLVYVNTITPPLWILAARLAGKPCLVHVREAEEIALGIRRALHAPLLLSQALVANSRATRENIAGSYPMLRRKCTVVYNGMDFPPRRDPTFDNSASATGVDGREWNIGLVGRLSPRKGQDFALRVLAELRGAGHEVNLHLYGDVYPGYEWYLRQLQESITQLGLSDVVHLHGFVHDVWSAYLACDVIWVTSRTEPFGNVALEAMAAGRPVVVSAVQGLIEIADGGKFCVIAEPDQLQDWVVATENILTDPSWRRDLVDKAQDHVRQNFTSDQYSARLLAVIDGVRTGKS